jgi:hypothetical protein
VSFDHWNRSPLTVLALLWALLWWLVSLIEFPAYLHDPTVPVWKPLILAGLPTAALLGWLMIELRTPNSSWRAMPQPASSAISTRPE